MRKKRRDLLRFLGGAIAVLLVWFFAVFLPLASSFRKIGSGWLDLSWPETIGQFFFNIYRNNMHRYMSLVPVLFIIALLFYRFWIGLVKYPSALFAFNYLGVRFFIYGAILATLWMWLKSTPRFDRIATASVFGVLALSSLTVYYAQFYKKPVYQLQGISNSLSQLPPDSVIMGNEAPRLALETGFRNFPAFEGWFNDQDPFRRQRPTHLLTLDKYWGGRNQMDQKALPGHRLQAQASATIPALGFDGVPLQGQLP